MQQSGEAPPDYSVVTNDVASMYALARAHALRPILADLRSRNVLLVDAALGALAEDFLPYVTELAASTPSGDAVRPIQPRAFGPLVCGLFFVFVFAVVGAVAIAVWAVLDPPVKSPAREHLVVRIADVVG